LRQFLHVPAPVDKVDLGRIPRQPGAGLAMNEEVLVSLPRRLEALDVNRVLERHFLLRKAPLRHLKLKL
jgi:hypothetical protein